MSDITYWRNPETNLIEGVTADGKVLTVQKSIDMPFDSATKNGFREHVSPTGEVTWVQEDLNDRAVARSWKYTPMIGGVIAAEVASGAALSTLHKKFDWCPPYAIIARWRQRVPEFKEMLEQALRDRAMIRHEEVLEIADATHKRMVGTEDEVAAAKLAIDARKHSAEKEDAERYGNKKTERDVGPIQILIQTGIQRDVPAPNPVVQIEGKK